MSTPTAETVACPFCSARYLLPAHLMGPGGAKVNCPSCHRAFVVPARPAEDPDSGRPSLAPPPAERAPRREAPAFPPAARDDARSAAAPPPAEGLSESAAQARAVVGALAERSGQRLIDAYGAGRLFAECGPELLAAWDDYRKRMGGSASATDFRLALVELLGIDLPEGLERSRR
jgi:predicted Zn finger-like uncharacterized protein